MPIMNQAPQQYTENVAGVGSVYSDVSGPAADGITYFGPFWPGPYRGFAILVNKTVDTGAPTTDFKLQTLNEVTGLYTDWLDSGGTTNLLLPQWANDSNVPKWMKVHPEALASDADNVLIVNTANRVYNEVWWAPFRMVLTVTGASTSVTVSIALTYLT
jgi:hypothetical protein